MVSLGSAERNNERASGCARECGFEGGSGASEIDSESGEYMFAVVHIRFPLGEIETETGTARVERVSLSIDNEQNFGRPTVSWRSIPWS
jgi:hypothetical protein